MQQTVLNASPTAVISHHHFAEVRLNPVTKQKSLYAITAFNPGDIICNFKAGQNFSEPNYLTVQTGVDKHITLQPEFLQYINHSCTPNAFFNTTSMQLVCIKDIVVGEEFSFFYPSTEWQMAQSFFCYCGATDCLQNIRGAKFLTQEQINKYTFTDFINSLLQPTVL
ncbi:MAG: SET domain-containing protein-lysine N-methyltransferase [Ferruginibacter sp.]